MSGTDCPQLWTSVQVLVERRSPLSRRHTYSMRGLIRRRETALYECEVRNQSSGKAIVSRFHAELVRPRYPLRLRGRRQTIISKPVGIPSQLYPVSGRQRDG